MSPSPIPRQPRHRAGGLPLALTAYLAWGLLPLYMRLLHAVPALAFVGWRTIFTLPVCLVLVTLRRQGAEVLGALRSPRVMAMLALSASLIGVNWLVYVSAIHEGHILATSLGYYINPLINILLGTLLLRERLGRLQWLAVALAGGGVALLALAGGSSDARATAVIALILGITFSAYGLVRKLVPVASLPGLAVEAGMLMIPGIAYVLTAEGPGAGAMADGFRFGANPSLSGILALSGVTTAVPLLLFSESTRRLDYSTLGFVQFLQPTVIFLLGLFVFHEPLRPAQLGAFAAIWAALAVFCWDMWAKRRGT